MSNYLVEVVCRDGPWVLIRIHGETIKLTCGAARALGKALLRLGEEPVEQKAKIAEQAKGEV